MIEELEPGALEGALGPGIRNNQVIRGADGIEFVLRERGEGAACGV